MLTKFPYSGFSEPIIDAGKTNIAFVGNSHIAAFALGWDKVKAEFPHIAITFFAGIKGAMSMLEVNGKKLVPTRKRAREALSWTSGLDHIPGDFDAYYIVGMQFGFPHVVSFLRSHRTLEVYSAEAGQQLISEAFLRAGLDEIVFSNGQAAVMVKKLRAITKAPVSLIPVPFLTTEVLTDPRFDRFWADEKMREFAWRIYRDEIEKIRKDTPVIEQPAQTIVDEMFTRPEYRHGAIRLVEGLNSQHKENDYRHMNANFGALSLREILQPIPAMAGAQS